MGINITRLCFGLADLFLYTLSDKGKGDASRKLQNWARNYRILKGKGERPC